MIKKYAKNTAGFSFVELMVVIALIGMLSAIALPSLLGSLSEKRLKNAARNLYSDMQRARLQAVKKNKKLFVRFSDGAGNKNDFYYFDENN
ncbi:prepilin-type N-terminal cleavage/methylation domain-containing protein, partial [Desulfobulbus sp. F1]|nr:prepilin-type N-terminal cleavage/methylation domain-containing protein [Desulfobulbus sp. F1]